MKHTHRLGGAFLTGLMALTFVPQSASADQMASEAGLGAAAALSTLVYGPVKLLYAVSGLVFGGIAWGLSGGDAEVMSAVVTPAVRGDYVITPPMLRMEQRVEFFGRDPEYREETAQVASGPAATSEPAVVSEDY